MLIFYRRIRKGLLESGNTNRHLVYAIGEIAFVVIGILIAAIKPFSRIKFDTITEPHSLQMRIHYFFLTN